MLLWLSGQCNEDKRQKEQLAENDAKGKAAAKLMFLVLKDTPLSKCVCFTHTSVSVYDATTTEESVPQEIGSFAVKHLHDMLVANGTWVYSYNRNEHNKPDNYCIV